MIYTLNRYICSYKHILCIKNKKKTKQILVYKKKISKTILETITQSKQMGK